MIKHENPELKRDSRRRRETEGVLTIDVTEVAYGTIEKTGSAGDGDG